MAIRSAGTILEVATDAVYTAVGEVSDFDGPTQSRPIIDTTGINDTARKKITGMLDPGTMSFTCFTDMGDAGQDIVRTAFGAGTLLHWKLKIPAGAGASTSVATTFSFDGFVTTQPMRGSVDGAITTNFTIAISGSVTEAATS